MLSVAAAVIFIKVDASLRVYFLCFSFACKYSVFGFIYDDYIFYILAVINPPIDGAGMKL